MDTISFKVSNDINLAGAFKKGTITTTFNRIMRVLGKPMKRNDGDSYNVWRIQIRVDDPEGGDFDYEIAAIYDWGEEFDPALDPNSKYTFNIGSKDLDGPYYVHHIIT